MKFSTVWENEYLMNSNGFFVGFNMPIALESKEQGNSEYAHRLPPYARRKAFLVDEYLACPSDWMRSSGRMTSYFVPIQEGRGLWLDFNKNQEKNYHVAIVISIQGVNPITGMPCTDAHLEQYIDTCPKHNEKFGPNRYCDKCGYKWPKQNYISTTGNNVDELWLDGFRTAEGIVRQYILTKEDTKRTKKGVATNIIGEDRVYAIGLSFFLSKEHRETPFHGNKRDQGNQWLSINTYSTSYPVKKVKSIPTKGGTGNASDIWNYYSTCTTGITRGNIVTPTQYGCDSINIISCAAPAAAAACSEPPDDDPVKSSIRSKKAKGSIITSDYKLGKSSTIIGTDFGVSEDEENEAENVSSAPDLVGGCLSRTAFTKTVKVDKMEVGAGANVNQAIGDDPEPLDFWRKDPEAIICVNYCSEEDCAKIIKAGKTKKSGHKEGFLKEVPVGN